MSKISIRTAAHGVLASWLVLFGLTGVFVGGPALLQAAQLSAKTLAYYAVSCAAGLALLVCCLLSFRAAWRRLMSVGCVFAALVLPLNQFLGLHFQAILCFTPS